ncbi:MAG: hypothetical protein ACI4U3_11095, partial [Traorella sp.]
MFDEHSLDHKIPNIPIVDDGIYYVSQNKKGIYLKENADSELLYLRNEEDKISLKDYLRGYVFAQIEVFPDNTCVVQSFSCNSLLSMINQHIELGLDWSTIRQLYYANIDESKRLIDILLCCIHYECYDGEYLTSPHIEILVKWLISNVNLNRYLELDDIFEDVYLPCGEKMTYDIYQYLLQIKGKARFTSLDILNYLLFVDKHAIEFNYSFNETYEEFKRRYPTYQHEIMQMLTYVYSLGDYPMNFMLKGANSNELLMILNEIGEYLGIGIVELAVSSFSDAGDLCGFNESYSGAEKGRIAEQVLKYRKTALIFVLKGLDEINISSSSHSSVLAALCEIMSNHKINDNFLKYEIDLSHALIVGTCFNENHVNQALMNSFYTIKDTTQISKDTITRELYSHLSKLHLGNIKIDERVIDKLVSISLMDPFHEIYQKYCNIIVQYYYNQKDFLRVIDEKLMDEVFDTFDVVDPIMKSYFDYYDDY